MYGRTTMARHATPWGYRWGLMTLLCGWLSASGCLCYGSDPPPEDDDDTEDSEQGTNNDDYPEYDVTGFYLDVGRHEGDGWYEGVVILENGAVRAWSGSDGTHQEETWLATLTEGQMTAVIDALDPDAFFGATIDVEGEPACFFEFRLDTRSGTAWHPAGQVPEELAGAYGELDEILGVFGIEHGCS